MLTKRPLSRRNLDLAIEREWGRDGYVRARTVMANAVVGQMLPEGAVKGGSALKLRLGEGTTRFTTDLDVARRGSLEGFVDAMNDLLAEGWEGFTGRLVEREPPRPAGIPSGYVMKPYEVKLSYAGKPWVTVPLEVGHDEIGDADEPERRISADVVAMFVRLGFPEPAPVPLMPLSHQVAQKLHALSSPGSERAHDLVDLQLIARDCPLDLPSTAGVCRRLFAYRKAQEWPPTIRCGEGWAELYAEQAEGLRVLGDVGDAVAWANRLVAEIDRAG